jgi:FkbM family methyltransferase
MGSDHERRNVVTPYSRRLLDTNPTCTDAGRLLTSLCETPFVFTSPVVDGSVALYGAGNMGQMARDYFGFLKIPISCVIDQRFKSVPDEDRWNGLPAFSPTTAPINIRKDTLLAVCVATSPYVELADTLRGLGWQRVAPFYDISESYRAQHPLSNGWYAPPFTENESMMIGQVLSQWADDRSRAHHLQFVAWRRLRQEWIFSNAEVIPENRFFIPEIVSTLGSNEYFVDVGAHVGSISHRFLAEVNNQFHRIVAIEPDSRNRTALSSSLSQIAERNKIEILPHIIGATHTPCRFFEGLGYPSQRCEFGDTKATMVTLDELDLAPTVLKLHLEGWELEALKGATKTIERCRPTIMATSYHNALGLWELPHWLMSNCEQYSFYMRQHTWCGTGCVIYAIPSEKMTAA